MTSPAEKNNFSAQEATSRFLTVTGISPHYHEALLISFPSIQKELESFLSLSDRSLKNLPSGIVSILKAERGSFLGRVGKDIFKRSSPNTPSKEGLEESSEILEGPSVEEFLNSVRRVSVQPYLPYHRYTILISKRKKNPDADP